MRIAQALFVTCLLQSGLAWGQGDDGASDIRDGHRLASELCSICHLATPDQATLPIRHPPAPPFATILQRKDLTSEWLTNFLKTTHRGLDEPNGMPNPDLADFQIKQIVAYLMSVQQRQ
jgi:mono/diheme cytochrome c family protein